MNLCLFIKMCWVSFPLAINMCLLPNYTKTSKNDPRESSILIMDLIRSIQQDIFNLVRLKDKHPSHAPGAGKAANNVFQTYELLEMILLELPNYDLVIATQVSPYWQDLIINSKRIRRRFLNDHFPPTIPSRVGENTSGPSCFFRIPQ